MKTLINIIMFFKLPLQIVVAAYISFALIAITIAWSEHKDKSEETVVVNETCRSPV